MTRSGVGRSWRTASRRSYASFPSGGWSSGSPSNQAVARRAPVRIDRAAVRLGLRTLIVAGFAGAAWLLCANAAQAADAPVTDRTTDLSVVDLPGPVTEAATLARQPVLGSATAPLTGMTPVGTTTSLVLPGTAALDATPLAEPADPAGASGSAPGRDVTASDGAVASSGARGAHGRDGTGTAPVGSVPGVVTRPPLDPAPALAGGLRHAAEPVLAALGTPADALTGLVVPVGDDRSDAVAPAAAGTGTVPGSAVVADGSVDGSVDGSTGDLAGGSVGAPADGSAGSGGGLAGGSAGSAGSADGSVGGSAGGAVGTAVRTRATSVGTPSTGLIGSRSGGLPGTRSDGTGTGEDPVAPAPTPARGSAAGGPAGGPGAPTEGGASGITSAVVMAGDAAVRRTPVATEVGIVRHDAEAPTVSPD